MSSAGAAAQSGEEGRDETEPGGAGGGFGHGHEEEGRRALGVVFGPAFEIDGKPGGEKRVISLEGVNEAQIAGEPYLAGYGKNQRIK